MGLSLIFALFLRFYGLQIRRLVRIHAFLLSAIYSSVWHRGHKLLTAPQTLSPMEDASNPAFLIAMIRLLGGFRRRQYIKLEGKAWLFLPQEAKDNVG